MTDSIIKVSNLKKYFPHPRGLLKAVDDISFVIKPGETLGLVGESGCGKSTLGKMLLQLEKPTSGEILFQGNPRKDCQMIFQDPYSSLNPRMTIQEILEEPLIIHKMHANKYARRQYIEQLLHLVGLDPDHANRFPHEFSGGQRQRIVIARALSLNPKFIICDEPIAALDVSIQAQIVNLLKTLQQTLNLTYLFISHDLAMVYYLSTHVAVMYLGCFMEVSDSKTLYGTPLHPYTQALLSAIAIPDPKLEKSRNRIVLSGEIPTPLNPPRGCAFCTRCPHAKKICHIQRPPLKEVTSGHFVSCHLH